VGNGFFLANFFKVIQLFMSTSNRRRVTVSKKFLMAVDGSEKGYEAVSIVGEFFRGCPDIEMTLFHCVPEVTGLLPGELFSGLEASLKASLADQQKVSDMVHSECRRRLVEVGFPQQNISFKLNPESVDAAEDIQLEAGKEGIRSIALGRRGRSQLETLLLGSVSSKVALYSRQHSVWIVDTPVHKTRRVLVAMQGLPDAKVLIDYVVEVLAPVPDVEYHFLHLMPPVPPTLWDDGHILSAEERNERQAQVEKWRSEWKVKVEQFMLQGCDSLKACGVPEKNVEMTVRVTKEGIARDLLNEVTAGQYQLVIIGKKSFDEKKPFLMGSHAHKVLQNVKGSIICMVDA
jgi:nucleotide-binding universal stress UspA family protein